MSEQRPKLIEHSLPLAAINVASIREKSVRHGHPSTLHLWWARRPLAACRAILFAQLVDDPSGWPEHFPDTESQARERRRLHGIIEDMLYWPKIAPAEQQTFRRAIERARVEIARSIAREKGEEGPAAHNAAAVLDYLQNEGPPVYDPFCGGGSIPLEAQRLGLRAYASDLNPVPVLINKALIDIPHRFRDLAPVHPDVATDKDLLDRRWRGAQGLAEDVRRYGQWVRDEAERRIGHLYPIVPVLDGSAHARVVAWIWARTIASPDPAFGGAHVPLMSSFLLSSKQGRETIVVPVRERDAPHGWRVTLETGELSPEAIATAKLGTKTARGTNFRCLLSGATIGSDYIQTEAKAGRLGQRLMAIALSIGGPRVYIEPDDEHEQAARVDRPSVAGLDASLPHDPRHFTTVEFGLDRFDTIFTDRQLVLLTTLSDLVDEARGQLLQASAGTPALQDRRDERTLSAEGTGNIAYADAVATYIGLAVSKLADAQSSLVRWSATTNQSVGTYGRQALPMVWDYAESNPFGDSAGDLAVTLRNMTRPLDSLMPDSPGHVSQIHAPENHYPVRPTVISTDPPYYDNIGYADLSDFFYVWLRRSLRSVHPTIFRRALTPKDNELIAMPYRHGGRDGAERHFMEGMKRSLEAIKNASADAPIAVYYAFKQSEVREAGMLSPGWAAFLQAIVNSGMQVDGTWPLRTERANRMIASGTNALASSIVLVCRRRPDDASAISRREFLRELRTTMRDALAAQAEAIPLPDRRQSAIGPGIGVFSRYLCVREADDSEMPVATALALINDEIDTALATGMESLDAPTRFALEWYEQHGFAQITGGAGQAIAMLGGFNLSDGEINRSGLFRAKAGHAKLLTREEMAEAYRATHRTSWSPATDESFTTWEMAQHLARVLQAQDGGVEACARLLVERRDSSADVERLVARLYDLGERGRVEEALVWNELQQAWPAILSATDRLEFEGVGRVPEQDQLL